MCISKKKYFFYYLDSWSKSCGLTTRSFIIIITVSCARPCIELRKSYLRILPYFQIHIRTGNSNTQFFQQNICQLLPCTLYVCYMTTNIVRFDCIMLIVHKEQKKISNHLSLGSSRFSLKFIRHALTLTQQTTLSASGERYFVASEQKSVG